MQNGEKHRAFEREAMLARTGDVLDGNGFRGEAVRPIAATAPIARSRANPRRGRASRSPVGALARLGGGFRRSGDRRGRPRSSCGNTCRGTVSPTRSWCAHNWRQDLASQAQTKQTWHYTFAKITPPSKQYQWLTTRSPAGTVEDQHESHRSTWPPRAAVRQISIAVITRRCAADRDSGGTHPPLPA